MLEAGHGVLGAAHPALGVGPSAEGRIGTSGTQLPRHIWRSQIKVDLLVEASLRTRASPSRVCPSIVPEF